MENQNQPEVAAEEDTYYYTEKSTSTVYEVKFFNGFVIARPPCPADFKSMRKIDIRTFSKEFELYAGDMSQVRRIIEQLDEMISIH